MVLEKAGYLVLTARDGQDALKRSQDVDLVICDHLLPGLQGVELAQQMKVEKPGVPIILFTGESEPPEGSQCADIFLNKLEGPVELLNKVAALLQRKSSET
jgi:DNA-binding response OmpR family regulator